MPASETPTNPPTPAPEAEDPKPARTAVEDAFPHTSDSDENGPSNAANDRRSSNGGYSTSRYVDYETHELLEKITEYEDERRWQRIREGIWISIIAHFLFFAALYFVPRYVFHQTQVIDPIQAIRDRKDLTYLDELPDALKQVQKAKPKLKPNETQVDKKTLDALKALEKARPKPTPPAPAPEEQARNTPPPAPVQPQPAPAPASNAPTVPSPQIPQEAPRPAPVPARPNFSLGSQNPADQLRQALRNSQGGQSGEARGGPLAQHPGASGGAEILSDTQGVDFGPWLQKAVRETHRAWDPIIPEEVNPPILKRGECEIVFTVLPNGRVQAGSMMLTGRSGDTALDRAAWGGIVGADYPPLPSEFHGQFLQLRFRFMYNTGH